MNLYKSEKDFIYGPGNPDRLGSRGPIPVIPYKSYIKDVEDKQNETVNWRRHHNSFVVLYGVKRTSRSECSRHSTPDNHFPNPSLGHEETRGFLAEKWNGVDTLLRSLL